MTSTSKPSPPRPHPPLGGVHIHPVVYGSDGYKVEPDGRPPRLPNRIVSVGLCGRSTGLRISFQACGFTYVGRPGTEDPLEAAQVGAALRDAIEARLLATGVIGAWLAVLHLMDNPGATPTHGADLSLMMTVVAALLRSAPRAVAEATASDGDKPAWSVRPIPAAVYRALG